VDAPGIILVVPHDLDSPLARLTCEAEGDVVQVNVNWPNVWPLDNTFVLGDVLDRLG